MEMASNKSAIGNRQSATLLPFPLLPEAIRARRAVEDLAIRPFGICEGDLNIDFNQPNRPLLITELLYLCTVGKRKMPTEFFWELSIGKRVQCLLTLALAGRGNDFELQFKCQEKSCNQGLEFELSLSEIAELQQQADDRENVSVEFNGKRVELRLPTGLDQLAWLKKSYKDEDEAAFEMISALAPGQSEKAFVFNGQRREWVEAISDAMADSDSLVNFNVNALCPDCGLENQFGVDLESLALKRLRAAQKEMLAMVHRLASRYHWSEREIFSVPQWRRSFYLSLIDKDDDK
jgi:hypothetical protein